MECVRFKSVCFYFVSENDISSIKLHTILILSIACCTQIYVKYFAHISYSYRMSHFLQLFLKLHLNMSFS